MINNIAVIPSRTKSYLFSEFNKKGIKYKTVDPLNDPDYDYPVSCSVHGCRTFLVTVIISEYKQEDIDQLLEKSVPLQLLKSMLADEKNYISES